MPIRFRCAYCDQLMGIATRKGGTVVTCPKCAGQVVVPKPEPESAAAEEQAPRDPNEVLEDEELAQLLEMSQEEIDRSGHSIPKATKANGSHRHATADARKLTVKALQERTVRDNEATVKNAQVVAPTVAPLAAAPSGNGFFMPMPVFYILSAVAVILLGMTFFAGYLMGKTAGLHQQPVMEKLDPK